MTPPRNSTPEHGTGSLPRSRTLKKMLLLGTMGILIALFFIFDLNQYLTLETIKARQQDLHMLYNEHTLALLAGYAAVYILSTALSLPGATILTLAGAAVFGFWTALIVVSFASSIGASLACIVSRYLLRDWVRSRFGNRLQRMDEGIAHEGPFYLFTLRLVPVIPFFLINLGMGLTSLPIRTFYWVSQLGMLPGTAVYVNAGKELSKIDSLSAILSPSLLASFVLLGFFPLAAKKTLAFMRKRNR